MPLVVPGLMGQSKDGDKQMEWANKLMGKKLGDQHDTTTFAKQELPKEHRIINEGDMTTMDHKPDRLNVHVGKDGTVQKVTHGNTFKAQLASLGWYGRIEPAWYNLIRRPEDVRKS